MWQKVSYLILLENSWGFGTIGLPRKFDLAWGVKAEISKLNDTISLIKVVVHDVEEQQRNNNDEVKIMGGNEIVKEVRLFFSKSNQLAYSLEMGHRVKAIRERLDKIAVDRAKFYLSHRPEEPLLDHMKRAKLIPMWLKKK
ncbi:hypothetical protein PTKIN_Ptkin09bG0267400 [Pterospermum kingtungense]